MASDHDTFAHGADIGVRGHGATPAAAFAAAARALTSLVTDPALVRPTTAVALQCHGDDLELLFVDWLNAVITAMATKRLLFGRFDVAIADGALTATAYGEPVDRARHQPAVEPKGATLTMLRVARAGDGWLAQTVVDV
jgi:SHS2 domain-containing protein